MLPGNFPPSHFQDWDSTLYPSLSSVMVCHIHKHKQHRPLLSTAMDRLPHIQTVGRAMLSHASTWRSNCLAKLQQPTRLSLQRRLCDDAFAPLARQVCWHVRSKPHTQTVGRAMLSHVSTWQRLTCNSWSLWTDCGRSNCLAKLQQPTRLSLQRRLCDDAFAPLARQVCWHVRSKPHTQTVGRAMLSHVSTWQRFTCNSWSLWTDCGRSNCLAKLQQPTRLSLQRRLCDDAFAPLARQVCWHVRSVSKPHTQTVGRAMLSHVSTWQRCTCNSWSLWTDCGRSNCLAKLQQPTRLSLQRRLCDDAFAPLARQVCWHVRSKPHTQTVGRAMLSHVSTWQRFTCNSWSLWTDCGRSNCLAKLQQPTRLSLQRRLCDDAFAPLARQVCWHVRSKPHTQTVGRAMLSHVSTWQRFTCHSWLSCKASTAYTTITAT